MPQPFPNAPELFRDLEVEVAEEGPRERPQGGVDEPAPEAGLDRAPGRLRVGPPLLLLTMRLTFWSRCRSYPHESRLGHLVVLVVVHGKLLSVTVLGRISPIVLDFLWPCSRRRLRRLGSVRIHVGLLPVPDRPLFGLDLTRLAVR